MVGGYPRKLNAALYLLVTIILGYLGVHRFLRGQIGIGLLYLLTGGLAGIGWIIDIICSIVWATQADPQGEITFVNKKYVPYQVISFPTAYNQPPQTLR
jgi:TM2 domain-containing membrane protein YozV